VNDTNGKQRKTPMKNTRLQRRLLAAVATLALASSVSLAQPTNIFIEPSFTDTGTTASGNGAVLSFTPGGGELFNWYVNMAAGPGITNSPNNAITNYTITFDTNNPPPSSPTGAIHGSVKNTVGWDVSTNLGGGGSTGGGASSFFILDNNFWGGGLNFDAGQYQSYEFDFKYDTNSTISSTNAAQFNITIDTHVIDNASQGFFLTNFANSGSTASNFDGNWHHVSIPIPSSIVNASRSQGPGYNMYNGAGISGEYTWWMANQELIARSIQVPPPVVSFVPVALGLNLINDKSPNYTRHEVRTDTAGDFNVDWVGHTPVTYTWNYTHAPTNNGAGVNFAITPDPVASTTYADPDWSSTNCFYLSINGVGGTSVVANVTVKTNQHSGNSTAMSIARLTNNTPTAAGTWSLTFTNDTDFVLTGPGGTNVSATIPANFLTTPYTGVSIFLSATPNNDQNYGSYASVSTFDVTGVATPIHENFTSGQVTSPFLVLQDQTYGLTTSPTGTNTIPNIVFVTTNDFAWFQWTIPDAGFAPIVRANLGPSGLWLDSPLTNTILNGTNRWTKVPKSYIASASQQYFGLVKRVFSQLQVILPGETNAPNTPSGKTGTPDPVSLNPGTQNGLETFTVNAVDSTFHIIPGVFDTVQITTTDGSATTPAPAALVNGTGTYQVQFGSTGSFTITASDTTHTNISSNISSTVTVGP
jgi:hypothetical protein